MATDELLETNTVTAAQIEQGTRFVHRGHRYQAVEDAVSQAGGIRYRFQARAWSKTAGRFFVVGFSFEADQRFDRWAVLGA